jgi:acyl-CoA-binding protein
MFIGPQAHAATSSYSASCAMVPSCKAWCRRLSRYVRRLGGGIDDDGDEPELRQPLRDGEADVVVDSFLENAFCEAAEAAKSLTDVSVRTKLELYALYKQSTVGDAPASAPTSLLDPSSALKWKAWARLRGTSRGRAMRLYLVAASDAYSGNEPSSGGAEQADDGLLDGVPLEELEAMYTGFAGPVMSSLAGNADEEPAADGPPLHGAAKGGDLAACKALLASGCAIDEADEDGHTALHWACDQGHREVAEYLLKAGAEVDAQNCDGSTPLHMACACEHTEVATLLVRRGSSLGVQDEDGCTALELAPKSMASMLRAESQTITS